MSPSTFWYQAIFSRSSVELLLDLVALETGQAAQAHLEDGVGLDRREAEPLDELGLGLLVVVLTHG